MAVYAYNMRYTDPCVRTAQSNNYADPSVTCPSLAKVHVNKVSIFNGILYVVPVAVHFHYIMRLCGQSRSEE